MVERAIVDRLDGNTDADTRIYPLALPREPEFPAITYQRISTPRRVDHDGDQGYTDFRTQLSCWAQRTDSGSGYAQARTVADQVRQRLNGWRGSAGGVTVGLMRVSGDRDERDPERTLERVLLEVSGNYRETEEDES